MKGHRKTVRASFQFLRCIADFDFFCEEGLSCLILFLVFDSISGMNLRSLSLASNVFGLKGVRPICESLQSRGNGDDTRAQSAGSRKLKIMSCNKF